MKPYYKRGGFFDRLEQWSHKIDYILKVYGIMYFIPGFRKFARIRYRINERECELYIAQQDLLEVRNEYNSKKYWWMRAK